MQARNEYSLRNKFLTPVKILGSLEHHLRSISETAKNNFSIAYTGIQIQCASKNVVSTSCKEKNKETIIFCLHIKCPSIGLAKILNFKMMNILMQHIHLGISAGIKPFHS